MQTFSFLLPSTFRYPLKRLAILATLLMLPLLFVWRLAVATPIFTVFPSTTGGSAIFNLPVSFTGTVRGATSTEAVESISVMEGSTVLASQSYNVRTDLRDRPINDTRSVNLNVSLPIGAHTLFLRTRQTVNGYTYGTADSSPYNITVTAQNNAAVVGQNVPTTMELGVPQPISVTMQNTGSGTWEPGGGNAHYLGSLEPDNNKWGLARIGLPNSVGSGSSVTFTTTATPRTLGTAQFQWQMVQENVQWFGPKTPPTMVNVVGTPPTMSGREVSDVPPRLQEGQSSMAVQVIGQGYAFSGFTLQSTELYYAGVKFASGTSSATGNLELGAGPHTIAVKGTDNRGIVGNASFTVTVLPPPPSIRFTKPIANASLNVGVPQTVSAVASGPVKTVRFTLPDGTRNVVASNLGEAQFDWTPTQQGTVTIGATSLDDKGTTLATGEVKVTVAPVSSPLKPVSIVPPHLENKDAGSLPGALSVGPDGAAHYSIEIAVPPGSAGLQPKLSLNYSSARGNGPLGLGWALGGLTTIRRCGKTIAQDGIIGKVKFDEADRLCLDGQRLVLVGSDSSDAAYWAPNAEYRTEIESFSRIRALVNNNGQRSFKVEDKDGRIEFYGSASGYELPVIGAVNSGVTAPQPVAKSGARAWALDKVIDRIGNYIKIEYEQDPVEGEHRPRIIRYGGVGKPAHAAVRFDYNTRADKWKRYVDETRDDLIKRLDAIWTFVGTNLDTSLNLESAARYYELGYDLSPTSGRTTLSTVRPCAYVSYEFSDCREPTVFNWGKPDVSKTPGFVSLGTWEGAPVLTTHNIYAGSQRTTMHADYFSFADFDNDGLSDVLEKRIASPRPSDYDTSADAKSEEGGNPIPPGTLQSQYRYFHNTGKRFDVYTYQLNTLEPFAVLANGDFNGDGAPDLVVWTAAGAKVCLSPLTDPSKLTSLIEFRCEGSYAAQGENKPALLPYVVDLRGDGRSALYGRIVSGKAMLCNQGHCDFDFSPPWTVLPSAGIPGVVEKVPVQAYTAFTDMVDFGGVGKTYDTRWSETYLYQEIDTGVKIVKWMNLQPMVTMTHFREPGAPEFPMQAYSYAEYPSSTCKDTTCRPYRFDHSLGGQMAGDFNGSGMSGLAFGYLQLGAANGASIYSKAEFTVCTSTGRALDCGVRQKYSGSNYLAPRAVGDFVGDGQPAILAEVIDLQAPIRPKPTGRLKMCRVTGADPSNGGSADDPTINCTDWNGMTLPDASEQVYEMDLMGTGRPQFVRYHSGSYVGGSWVEDGRWEVFAPVDVARDGEALDRIVSVTNGFGERSSVEYVDGVASGAVALTGASALTYPQRAQSRPGKVVKRLRSANGVGAERTLAFQYQNFGFDLFGRGSLGYETVITTDETTGAVTTNIASQQWPYVGMTKSSRTVMKGITLASTANVLKEKTFSTAGGTRRFPFIENATTVKADLDGASLGSTETNSVFDDWGNLKTQTVTSRGSPEGDYILTTTTDFDIDEARWLLNKSNQVTVSSTVPAMRAPNTAPQASRTLVRTLSRSYVPETGLLDTETTEPNGGSDVKVVTGYTRNAFGLVTTAKQTWTAPNGSVRSRAPKVLSYDENGRFVTGVQYFPQAGQSTTYSESFTVDAASGVRTSHTDINGQTTTWKVNGFGEVVRESLADGNSKLLYFKRCSDADTLRCPIGARSARITDYQNGGIRVAVPTLAYFDGAGHLLNSLTWGFNGEEIREEHHYDGRGRLEFTNERHFANASAHQVTSYGYDDLDRVTSVATRDEGNKEQSVRTTFSGFQRTITDQRGNSRIEYRNGLDRLMTVIDGAGKTTEFEYEPFGNLVRTLDPYKNKVEVEYDLYGRKKKLADPDLGIVNYEVDALGRTWSQRSPRQTIAEKTIFEFDDLDRMVRRLEPDLVSIWEYDTATYGNGKLAKSWTVAGQETDYSRTHFYDKRSRLVETQQVLTDATYRAVTKYDDWGRPERETYQRGTQPAKVYDLRYNSFGYRSSLERAGQTLWEATSQDAAQRVTAATLGNKLKEVFDYNPYSGRLNGSTVSTTAGSLRLQDGYQYEPNGQARLRTLNWLQNAWSASRGFVEEYTYDKLNRLWTVRQDGGATESYVYDDIGNIISKPGVGTYVYANNGGQAIGHAVKEVRDGTGTSLGSYEYDDNGNLSVGGGRKVDWTSFDMPKRISKGTSTWSDFVYGPEHQRIRQMRSDGQQNIYAGAQQSERNCTGFDLATCTLSKVKTFWPQGVGVEVDEGGQTKLYWTHGDRQGSEVALSDVNGDLVEVLAYDPWGKRRSINGTTTEGDGVIDDHGYTGHEMLDQLGLVHMNGRVYDPVLGRFLSADPYIQAPENGQSYNRYSYVWNDPVNMQDPTGYDAEKKCDPPESCNLPLPKLSISNEKSEDEKRAEKGTAGKERKRKSEGTDTGQSANNEKGFVDKAKDFLGQANRLWGLFDGLVPSRGSFESGVNQLLGPCFQNCDGHNALAQSTTDVMQGAAQGVAEAANRYYPELLKNMLAAGAIEVATAKTMVLLAEQSGMLRAAALGKGNFGIGQATAQEAEAMGRAWVGPNYRVASDGKTLVSADGLWTFRPPSPKNSPYATTGVQANFERLEMVRGRPASIGNAHLDITR